MSVRKLMLVVIPFLLFSCGNSEKVEVGQTWRYILDENNPYEKPIFIDDIIIDVQGEYVLFIRNKKDTLSKNKRWFTRYSTLIKNSAKNEK